MVEFATTPPMVGYDRMAEHRSDFSFRWTLLASMMLSFGVCGTQLVYSDDPKRLDPAAWGSDHVGLPVPDYATGDQCLFCHRDKIGPGWSANRHNLTIRPFDTQSSARDALKLSTAKDTVDEIMYIMGDKQRQRFLKSAKSYGQLELLSTSWMPAKDEVSGKLMSVERPHWDSQIFGDSCAGCHATAVDSKTKAFSSPSLDCFVCHGNVPTEHAKKPELAFFSARRKSEPRVESSTCAQCHIRTGKSKSTGLPYPNNFVAGDNLFRDFKIDFSDQALKKLSTGDRHVVENVRDVVVFGKETVTCLSCHDVHSRSSKKHRLVPKNDSCMTCHDADGFRLDRKPFTTHSKTCGY
jgi:Cytochrome c3/Doubled CXXCH motif (Paired_CXXCH_1)